MLLLWPSANCKAGWLTICLHSSTSHPRRREHRSISLLSSPSRLATPKRAPFPTSLDSPLHLSMATRCEILCEVLLAIFLPPIGVCFRHGCCSVEFFICLVLTILGYVPGIVYALYAILCVDRDLYPGDRYHPLV